MYNGNIFITNILGVYDISWKIINNWYIGIYEIICKLIAIGCFLIIGQIINIRVS